MANKRSQIEMSEEEIQAFLDEQKVVIATTLGPRGWPHSMPLWYLVDDGRIRAWTFRKSQKVKNLERDPRATLLVEAGNDVYGDLRGLMYETEAVVHDDPDTLLDFATRLTRRYAADGAEPTPEMLDTFQKQVPKRILFEFVPVRTVSWNHRKLGGAY